MNLNDIDTALIPAEAAHRSLAARTGTLALLAAATAIREELSHRGPPGTAADNEDHGQPGAGQRGPGSFRSPGPRPLPGRAGAGSRIA